MNRRAWGIAAVIAALRPLALAAQVSAGATIDHYEFSDPSAAGLASLEVRAAPFEASAVRGSLALSARGGWLQGIVTGGHGITARLSGLADSEVAIGVASPQGRFALRAVALPPTPTGAESLAEAHVAALAASELFSFPVRRWAGNGGYGADLAFVPPVDAVHVTLGIGYRSAVEGDLLDGRDQRYRPGDQLRTYAILDGRLGAAHRLMMRVGWEWFGADRVDGEDVFHPGARLDAGAAYTFPMGQRGGGRVSVEVRQRPEGHATLTAGFPGPEVDPSRTLYTASGMLSGSVGRLRLEPVAEARILSGDAVVCLAVEATFDAQKVTCPTSRGWLASGGLTTELRLSGGRDGRRLVLAPTAQYAIGKMFTGARGNIGKLSATEVASSLTGWRVGATLRVEAGR